MVNNTGTADLTSVEVQAPDVEGLLCQQFKPSTIGECHEKALYYSVNRDRWEHNASREVAR